ncbi:DUF934 domain-containing protein [Ketobacter sp. MCCC 1A13808]|uniref:DUF934 domain-containing protein n=1 Tax=Ketobacter sp. MCCC 1A13808 TaxID=2602738 RepID=UPI000F195CBE|nr:DUF934 domain-containing protein [Ketobacter sp. MCCC 1A13808]MVF12417.1 DUF934 domain-containing protein [Ketobacter sp. MCCC 1A13808]RLP55769.1 MAG: DUF934 domain-containing protein [Ketobacter sp.]
MPRKIIKDRAIVEDTFTLVESEAALPSSGDILIDLSVWPELKDKLDNYSGNIAVKVPGDAEPEDFADDLNKLAMVAIDFPVFRDGRGYSLARILRGRFNFQGELRATGDVLKDQLFYLQRCGFNSFATREDRCIEDALLSLRDFTVTYQADAHEKKPIYHRR